MVVGLNSSHGNRVDSCLDITMAFERMQYFILGVFHLVNNNI